MCFEINGLKNLKLTILRFQPRPLIYILSYIPLPKVLNNSFKGLINLKNKDHECFMWCHFRLINPTNGHPESINKQDKKLLLI